jgi:uncharacterized tellurite resistance protein B-like protein
MERAIAGYNMLMLLTAVDNKLNTKEDLVVREWLANSFPARPNLDEEMEKLSGLSVDEYATHFHEQMDVFYKHSTLQERNNFLQFAMFLIKADGNISKEENKFFDMLFDAWNEGE